MVVGDFGLAGEEGGRVFGGAGFAFGAFFCGGVAGESLRHEAIHQRHEFCRGARGAALDEGAHLCGDAEMKFGFAVNGGIDDLTSGAAGADGDDRNGIADGEPGVFLFGLAGEDGVAGTAGAHEAGANGGDQDVVFGEFGAEPFAVADQSEFAGGVWKQMRKGDFAADRGDVDDATLAATFHGGENFTDGVEGPPEIGLHGVFEGFGFLIFRGADEDGAGVVDQNVDFVEFAADLLKDASDFGAKADVAGEREDGMAGVGEFFTDAFEFLFIARANCDAAPRSANSRARTRPRPREPPVINTVLPRREILRELRRATLAMPAAVATAPATAKMVFQLRDIVSSIPSVNIECCNQR